MSVTFEVSLDIDHTALNLAFYGDELGPICEWSDLRSRTCGHCKYGPAAYTDFPSAEELWT